MGDRIDDLSSDHTYQQISKGLEIAGSIPVGAGLPSILRIPIPGTNGLAIELSPRGWTPKGGTTSTIFIQSSDGKRMLRLDYGYNKTTNSVNFHWNQKGTKDVFGITNHQPAGPGAEALYKGARVFRYAGRVLLVVGAVTDIASIVVATDKWRQVAIVGGGWAGAWAGAEAGGAGGSAVGFWLGSEVPLIGNALGAAAGGLVGGIGGGIAGYFAGTKVAEYTYDNRSQIAAKAAAAIEELTGKVDPAALMAVP